MIQCIMIIRTNTFLNIYNESLASENYCDKFNIIKNVN
jgi:hypothetical protein